MAVWPGFWVLAVLKYAPKFSVMSEMRASFSGATGAGRLHLVAVDTQSRSLGVGAALVARAVEDLIARGARFVIAEIPDDETALDGYRSLLAACSFSEEARVPDLYRDGVALSFMRRDLGTAS